MSFHLFTHNGDTFAFHPVTLQSERLRPEGSASRWPSAVTLDMQGKSPRTAPPDTLVLMLTYACNMACRYCCQGEIPDTDQFEMPEETAKKSIDWLVDASGSAPVVGLGFMGGEPFMKFQLMKALTGYAREKTMDAGKSLTIGAMTNGLLLSEEIIDFIASNRMKLTVSFDGPLSVQNENRVLKDGTPSYEKIVPNLLRLTSRYPFVNVRPTVYADEDLDAVLAECMRLGFRECRLASVSSSLLPNGKKNDEASATDAFVAHFKRQADRLIDSAEKRDEHSLARIAFDAVFREAVMAAVEANDDLSLPKRRWFMCSAGRSFLTIDVMGDIYPCPRFIALPEHRMGSVEDRTFEHGEHRKSLVIHGEDCRDCWVRYLCGGGCVIEHLGATGSLFRANEHTCRLRKGKFEQAIRVACSLDTPSLQFLMKCFRSGS